MHSSNYVPCVQIILNASTSRLIQFSENPEFMLENFYSKMSREYHECCTKPFSSNFLWIYFNVYICDEYTIIYFNNQIEVGKSLTWRRKNYNNP